MRIRPPGADEDGLHRGLIPQVLGEGGFHRFGVARKVEVVGARGGGDEGLDFGEGVRGDDVDGLDAWGRWRGRVCVEGGEEEDEEDETVFAAVVGEGEFGEAAVVVGDCQYVGPMEL